MADNVRFGLLPETLIKDTAKLVSESFVGSNNGWKYLCYNDKARNILTKNVYERIINNSKSNMYVLFDSEKYGDISSIIGFIEIVSPNNKYKIKDCLFLCIDYLILAPFHLNDGISFIWRSIKFLSIIDYLLHDIMTKHIGDYWYFNNLCIKNELKLKGNGSKMLSFAHQKCAIDIKHSDKPIFVITFTPKMVEFYVKNGYKLVVDVSMKENNGMSCYGLLYHFDKNKLEKYVDTLSKQIKYKQEFNAFNYVLPQRIKSWIMFSNLILISIPFLILYFPAIWIARWLSPESAWDL